MSRNEAHKQLAGTFRFELQGGQVLVRDDSLLEEIRLMFEAAPPHAVANARTANGLNHPAVHYGAGA